MYCLDDGAILKDHLHDENSIDEVANSCLPLVLKFGAIYGRGNQVSSSTKVSSHSKKIILGGWSYGGVVASVVAGKLASNQSDDSKDLLEVSGLVLFDAPLRLQATETTNSETDEEDKVAVHFSYCTRLLKKHYARPVVATPALQCPVLDIRALQSTYDGGINAVREITGGEISRHQTAGDHFTMLFGDNAKGVAKILRDFVHETNC